MDILPLGQQQAHAWLYGLGGQRIRNRRQNHWVASSWIYDCSLCPHCYHSQRQHHHLTYSRGAERISLKLEQQQKKRELLQRPLHPPPLGPPWLSTPLLNSPSLCHLYATRSGEPTMWTNLTCAEVSTHKSSGQCKHLLARVMRMSGMKKSIKRSSNSQSHVHDAPSLSACSKRTLTWGGRPIFGMQAWSCVNFTPNRSNFQVSVYITLLCIHYITSGSLLTSLGIISI